jgi:hypothetical protein
MGLFQDRVGILSVLSSWLFFARRVVQCLDWPLDRVN